MSSGIRRFVESPMHRGVGEEYPYSFDLSKLPSGTYANAVCQVLTEDGSDVTTSVLSTSVASVASTTFTTPAFTAGGMTAGNKYKLIWKVDIDSREWNGYGWINAEAD